MFQRYLSVLVVVSAIITAVTVHGADDRNEKQVLGTWKIVSAKFDGQDVADNIPKEARLILEKERLRFQTSDENQFDGTYKADPNTEPQLIDVIREDPETKKTITLEGIYKVDGDTLTICVQPPDAVVKQRPTRFESHEGSGIVLLVLMRTEQ